MRTAQNSLFHGFTLIELLITISIITIITGASLPSFNSYIKNQNVKQSQEKVKDDLRTVQNRALNGQDAEVLLSGNKVNYWGIEFAQGEAAYTYFISTDTSSCGPAANRQDFRVSEILPGDNVVRSEDGCVFFSFENGDAFFSPAPADTIIIGPPTGSTGCKRLEVTPVGLIQAITNNDLCT